MPKSAALETSILALILNGTPIANIADNTATAPLGNLYASLHTAAPGASGNQSTSEIAYTGYARVAIVRNNGSPGWTISGSAPAAASPNAAINFGQMTAGAGGTATYLAIGTQASGAGEILYYGALSTPISVVNGVQPQISTSMTVTET